MCVCVFLQCSGSDALWVNQCLYTHLVLCMYTHTAHTCLFSVQAMVCVSSAGERSSSVTELAITLHLTNYMQTKGGQQQRHLSQSLTL